MGKKPKIFIASSVEGLEIAKIVNVKLEYITEPTLWTDVFKLSSITLLSLIEKAEETDFAIFIFTPDDKVSIRDNKKNIVRDNVLFELGLFIGKLGLKNCFIIKPRNVDLHILTDLAGITIATYDENRSDKNLTSALTTPCTNIELAMQKIKIVKSTNKHFTTSKLKKHDFALIQNLKALLPSSGVIKFVNETDFGGSFIQKKIDPLYHFTENFNNAEHEFLDKELEIAKIVLLEKSNKFLLNIAQKTAPLENNPNLQTVYPHNFDHSNAMKKKVDSEIKAIHSSADELFKSHQEFIRISNRKNP